MSFCDDRFVEFLKILRGVHQVTEHLEGGWTSCVGVTITHRKVNEVEVVVLCEPRSTLVIHRENTDFSVHLSGHCVERSVLEHFEVERLNGLRRTLVVGSENACFVGERSGQGDSEASSFVEGAERAALFDRSEPVKERL